MASWSCGYQHDCNSVLGRNTQSMRNSPFLLPSPRRSILTPCLTPAAPPALDTDPRDGLQAFHGLNPAVEKLQFPQECLEFPPLCNTRLQVPALMREYLHFPGEYSHTRAGSLNNPSHHPKPKADELLFLLFRASKTLRFFFFLSVHVLI